MFLNFHIILNFSIFHRYLVLFFRLKHITVIFKLFLIYYETSHMQ
ncbi:rCG24510 [Rattus norvegicus]|uniref:RCG24510 n=1 Tax=Rattus norvegicus TaxID=10116 RepID=A6K6R9_RAT|nr:rCG24510 [Rattus norvegicus]